MPLRLSNQFKFLFLIHFLFCFSAGFGQNSVKITENFQSVSLNEALEILMVKYHLKIAYDNQLAGQIQITAVFENQPVNRVLVNLLENTAFELVEINGVYILSPTNNSKQKNNDLQAPVKLSGIVKDKKTGEPLPYLKIKNSTNNKEMTANSDGFFSVRSDYPDSMAIRFTYLGYKPVEVRILTPVTIQNLVLELEPEPTDSLPTQSGKLFTIDPVTGFYCWNAAMNSNFPVVSNIDPFAPLQFLPGINATAEATSGLMVRHSPSDQNLIVYDGFYLYQADHFFGAISAFNSKAMKDIRFSRGGFDARWGGRISSVFEITGKIGNDNTISADAGIDPLCADVLVEGPLMKKVTFAGALRHSFTGFYRSNLYNSLFAVARNDIEANRKKPSAFTDEENIPLVSFYDFNAKISFKPSEKELLSVTGFSSFDFLNYKDNETTKTIAEESDWGTQAAGLRWTKQLAGGYYQLLTAGWSEYSLHYQHDESKTEPTLQVNVFDTIDKHLKTRNILKDNDISLMFGTPSGKNFKAESGLSIHRVNSDIYDYTLNLLNNDTIIDHQHTGSTTSDIATYWGQAIFYNNKLKNLTVGMRATWHQQTRKMYYEPRISAAISPSELITLKASTGIYYQFVNRIILSQYGNYRYQWINSDNDRFPVVKSSYVSAGCVWEPVENITVETEVYLKNTNNMIFIYDQVKRNGLFRYSIERKYFQVQNHTRGIDLLVRQKLGPHEAWIGYSFSKSMNQCDEINKGEWYPASTDIKHEVKLSGIVRIKKISFTLQTVAASGKPYDNPTFTRTLQVSPDYSKNSENLPLFFRTDAGCSYLTYWQKFRTEAGIKAINIFDYANITGKPYNWNSKPVADILNNRPPITFIEIPGMGFTLSWFISIRF